MKWIPADGGKNSPPAGLLFTVVSQQIHTHSVKSTLIQRHDVESMLIQCCVHSGKVITV